MLNAMMIEPQDNVVVAIEAIAAGDTVTYVVKGEEVSLTAKEDITIYHKIAVRDIQQGEPVVKYGEHIGAATAFIPKGGHVHVQNVDSLKEDRRAKE